MKKSIALLIVAATIALAVPAFAELQNVVVGGSIRIRGNWFDMGNTNATLVGRVWANHAPANVWALGSTTSDKFAEERTRLNVRADFTDNVSAFIELDSYSKWGEDFRSNYLTGVDYRPSGLNSVEVYQAYIEAKEMWGTALKARIGRQELKFGSGFVLGSGDRAPYFTGLSFDAIRLTYATDQFSVDAFAAKLAEQSPKFEDGDIDLYGIYASYLGIENITLDAYALMIRDAANNAIGDPRTGIAVGGAMDTYTFGLRGAGTVGAIDFDAEVAYQLVNWDKGSNDVDGDGDNDLAGFPKIDTSADLFAGNLEVGYTFDTTWTPRVFVAGAYLDGDKGKFDAATGTFTSKPCTFNRLFSDVSYSKILDGGINPGVRLTNIWTAAAGVSAVPTESVKLQLSGAYLSTVEDFGAGSTLGWELDASAVYNYTQDLAFKAGYSHLFADDLGDAAKGAVMASGFDHANVKLVDDINYFYLETKLSF